MKINSLELKNFRNYEYLSIEFDKDTNIIYGDNAQGKTNILESIYVAATSKSHKSSKDRELIRFDELESHIKAVIDKKGVPYRIDIHIKKNKNKGIAINGIPLKRATELFGIINIVVFSPEDLNIIKEGPMARRRFIDMELSQIDRLYLSDINNYNKILNNRNKLLKDIAFDNSLMDTLDIWDMQLVSYAKKIIKAREQFINNLNSIISGIHSNLTGHKESLIIKYEPNVEEYDIEKILASSRDRDIKTRMTNYGPHKDDICFEIDGIDVRRYGSQGQQRTCALSLKLSEIELVRNIIKDSPILLLDDVLSELDSNRQNYLLNSIENIQTIITCTGLDEFINNRFSINKIYKVTNGNVTVEN